ncbi:TrbG/VirB9 family P-type conjugative transfer protein [Marinicella sp. W31]|uniref:TrbG/VirB9 family P-type conjugative transfer protein n=1 Tax=Marinicella sp. W31 TaxID=3023713 RepID=UPI00375637BE
MRYLTLTFITLMMFFSGESIAVNAPSDHKNDKRIKTIAYRPNDVMPISVAFNHVTHIDLGSGNTITDVHMGDTYSWLLEWTEKKDGVLVKPLIEGARTNLVLITENKKYYFDLKHSQYANTYSIIFHYPEDEMKKRKAELAQEKRSSVNKDLEIAKVSPENWNFNFLLEGDNLTSPVHMFDDGKFTYLEFGKKKIPAIFAVDKHKNESVVNYHQSGRYIVIEGLFKQLTLRSGEYSTCIFNKSYLDQMDENPITLNKVNLEVESHE